SVTLGPFRLGSFGKSQAPTASTPSASARHLIRIAPSLCHSMVVPVLVGAGISEVHREREEIAARRRIRRDILTALDVLDAEVRDFGIESLVRGPRHQIAAAQVRADTRHPPPEQRADEALRKLIGDSDL